MNCSTCCLIVGLFWGSAIAGGETHWISALDDDLVERRGGWREERYRYADASHLQTAEEDATLALEFAGTGLSIRLGGQQVPAYGATSKGKLLVTVDGAPTKTIFLLTAPREVTIVTGLKKGQHQVLVQHQRVQGAAGGRVEGFRVWDEPCGEVRFSVSGERNAFLVDVRATLFRDGMLVRNGIARNWLNGECCLSGIPPGNDYSLEIQAVGWRAVQRQQITVVGSEQTTLPPIHLERDSATTNQRFRFPALNNPAIRRPGESFRARFLGSQSTIEEVRLTRKIGPATISRKLQFREDEAAAHYYDREIIAQLPDDLPSGAYNLTVRIVVGERSGICRSPNSVFVVSHYPQNPVLVTWGHLDTSGQYQAEYLARLVRMTNLISPDIVLNSNAVNAAYISGAMTELDMPHVVNFGNHQFPGHEFWYGDPVNLIDFGPKFCVLNFGHPWHAGSQLADALLASRADRDIKLINAFEANAPLDLLDRHRVNVIHDAHGIGQKVMDLGRTPTRRIGKTNAESFRVVRMKDGFVQSCTYQGHETAPYPFTREEQPPLRTDFSPANNGKYDVVTATVSNDFQEDFPDGRLTFVMPAGTYQTSTGKISETFDSDDGMFTVVVVRVDFPKISQVKVRVSALRESK